MESPSRRPAATVTTIHRGLDRPNTSTVFHFCAIVSSLQRMSFDWKMILIIRRSGAQHRSLFVLTIMWIRCDVVFVEIPSKCHSIFWAASAIPQWMNANEAVSDTMWPALVPRSNDSISQTIFLSLQLHRCNHWFALAARLVICPCLRSRWRWSLLPSSCARMLSESNAIVWAHKHNRNDPLPIRSIECAPHVHRFSDCNAYRR